MDAPVSELLSAWGRGDEGARDRLAAAMYPEMRRLAGRLFRHEPADHTLQPTALVNEAWLRLSGSTALDDADHSRLMILVTRLMREILVDHARRRAAAKRDGGERVNLTDVDRSNEGISLDLLDLDRALAELERLDAIKARIIELRYFGGMTIEDVADALGLSSATIKRHWQTARIWLFDRIGPAPA